MQHSPGIERDGGATIRVLSALVQNQIAAGEVVERPASVVKELVDNALDAGARHVRIDLEEGGVKLVRVTDDGAGMGAADLALCFQPFATSKLEVPEDLQHIATLGFRGEALASIGSVARCRVRSRLRGATGQAGGHEIENHGGQLSSVRAAAAPEGTQVEVRDLFFNTPARRRFLKTKATELARVLEVLQRLALAHVGTAFDVHHDGRRVFDVEQGMDLLARVRRFFGGDLADALVPVSARDGDAVLAGLLAPPRFARGDGTRQMWFLNGRPLRDKLLARCLKEAYRGYLVEGRQPVAFLALGMDPRLVDVNVHPQKAEVRFRDQRRVFAFLQRELAAAVRATDMATPGERLLAIAARRTHAPTAPFVFTPVRPLAPAAAVTSAGGAAELAERPRAEAEPTPLAAAGELAGPFLQIARTYLVRALDDGFEIVDQHALHERVTFEALKAELAAGALEVQRLLVPEPVEVGPAGARLLEDQRASLAAIGIHLARFGEGTVAVDGLPARLGRADAEELVRVALEILERTDKVPPAGELLEELLHRRACRASVMAGDALEPEEIRALLARAAALPSDQTCPHARPTRVRFTLADLEKAFHRR